MWHGEIEGKCKSQFELIETLRAFGHFIRASWVVRGFDLIYYRFVQVLQIGSRDDIFQHEGHFFRVCRVSGNELFIPLGLVSLIAPGYSQN